MKDDTIPGGKAAIDLYFIQDDGGMFKTTIPFEPYFYVGCKVSFDYFPSIPSFPLPFVHVGSGRAGGLTFRLLVRDQLGTETIVEEWLMKKYEGLVTKVVRVKKEDLKLVSFSVPPSLLSSLHPLISSASSHHLSLSPSPIISWATDRPSSNSPSTTPPISSPSDEKSFLSLSGTEPNSMPSTRMPRSWRLRWSGWRWRMMGLVVELGRVGLLERERGRAGSWNRASV